MDTVLDLLSRDPASVAAAFNVRLSGNDLVLYFPIEVFEEANQAYEAVGS